MTIGNGGNPSSHAPGYQPQNKWGGNIDIDTADALLGQKIWPVKAGTQLYLFLDAAVELFVVSLDANDTSAGTGAQTVTGLLHDSAGEEQAFTKSMAGLANVSLGLSVGVFRFEVATSGATNSNIGQLKIVDGGGDIYAVINPGEGQTQIAVTRCPDNKKGLVKCHETGYGRISGGSNTAAMRLKIRKPDGTTVTKWDPLITSVLPLDRKEYIVGGLNIAPGEWLYWEAITVSANDTPVRATFDIEFSDI